MIPELNKAISRSLSCESSSESILSERLYLQKRLHSAKKPVIELNYE
jgi:hypothetical protein